MAAMTAEITVAILRFANPLSARESPIEWSLWPKLQRLSNRELVEALDAMPKPAFVAAHLELGGLTAISLAACAPSERARLDAHCRNQTECLIDVLDQLAPDGEPRSVLLEIPDYSLEFSTIDVEAWTREFVVASCGWSIERSSDPRAALRLVLIRSDGVWSPGSSLPPFASARPSAHG